MAVLSDHPGGDSGSTGRWRGSRAFESDGTLDLKRLGNVDILIELVSEGTSNGELPHRH